MRSIACGVGLKVGAGETDRPQAAQAIDAGGRGSFDGAEIHRTLAGCACFVYFDAIRQFPPDSLFS